MKFRLYLLTLIFSVAGSVYGQNNVIDQIFTGKNADFKSQVELLDTIEYPAYYYDPYSYYEYESKFGLTDFRFFMVYQLKSTGKKGLIVYGDSKSAFTEPIADSIYFMNYKEFEANEGYDEQGNYVYNLVAKSLYFYFENETGGDELWTIACSSAGYTLQSDGKVQKDLFKAVAFTEVVNEETGNYVTGILANTRTNKVYNSSVLNDAVIRNEVYAYHYDNYGEYDYYYDYAQPETDYSVPTFETRMNYEPIEIVYLMDGDNISEVITYSYPEADPLSLNRKVVPENFAGVWKNTADEYGSLLIFDGDDIYNGYNSYQTTVDSYKGLYEVGTYSWDQVKSKLNLPAEELSKIESALKGNKNQIRFISNTAFNVSYRFKDYYLGTDQVMLHVYLDSDYEGNRTVGIETLEPQKIYEMMAMAEYDSYTYTTKLTDEQGNPIDLVTLGAEYYYNYNLAVAPRNRDKEGNLILTREELGSISFLNYSAGDQYVGKVRVQWIGAPKLEEGATIVGIKSMPHKIVDQSGGVLADNIFNLYVTNVQGFNLFQIYNTESKVGVLGPDGKWLLKQEWDMVNVLGPMSSYGYEYGTMGFPIFFNVYKEEKCGAIDAKGNWIVPMGYDFIEICSEQIIASREGKITVYSFDGKVLLENISGFGGGYYGYSTDCYTFDYTADGNRVVFKDDRCGMVDKDFKLVMPYEYTSIVAVGSGNTYVVSNSDNLYGMVDSKNNQILPFSYEFISPFDYNPSRFVASKDGKQGVIDVSGKVIIPFEFYSISTSSDWYGNIIYISDPDYRTNIVDTTGKSILGGECSYVYFYYDQQIFSCSGTDGSYSFYDRGGAMMYSRIAAYVDPYSCYEGVQIYQNGDYETPEYGCFDIYSGVDILPANFESLYPFWINDQMFFAGVVKGKLGIYAPNGTLLVKPKGMYLDNYYYDDGYYGGEVGYFVEISNAKGKSKIIKLNW